MDNFWKVTTEGPMFHWTMIVGGVDQQSHVFVSWSVIQKIPHKNKIMQISRCPVLLPKPPPPTLWCFFSRTFNKLHQPLQPVPCTLGAMFTGTPMFASNVAINWWGTDPPLEKTVRRDCRRIKIRLQGILWWNPENAGTIWYQALIF